MRTRNEREDDNTHEELALGIQRSVNDALGGVDEAPRVIATQAAPPRALDAGALLPAHEALEGDAVFVELVQQDGVELLRGKPHLESWGRH